MTTSSPPTPGTSDALGLRPDYSGKGILNLINSVVAGRGGEPEAPTLEALPPEQLEPRRNVVLMIIDGLGDGFLGQRPHSFLYRHRRVAMTSVFPTTTATAITTYMTALAPATHGLTGWFTYLRELGSVAAVLPFRPRHGGAGYAHAGVRAEDLFHWAPVADRIATLPYVVTAKSIADSDYSRCTAGRAPREVYQDLEGFFRQTATVVTAHSAPKFVYAYWPELDRTCHEHGVASAQAEEQFQALDAGVVEFLDTIAGSDTTVIISADHGLIDTAPARTLWLTDHRRLADTLALPLCGEPRVAYCYLRPGRRKAFESYVDGELAEACTRVPAEQALAEGLFGDGPVHPELPRRVGDQLLVMRENYILKDQLLGESAFQQVGVHGGLSPEELHVPLIVLNV